MFLQLVIRRKPWPAPVTQAHQVHCACTGECDRAVCHTASIASFGDTRADHSTLNGADATRLAVLSALKLQPPRFALHLMPTERLPAIGNDGGAYIVVKKSPAFAPGRRNPAAVMVTYQLSTGEALTPTAKPHTFRLMEGVLEVTLVT
jgi:hypothetical protein